MEWWWYTHRKTIFQKEKVTKVFKIKKKKLTTMTMIMSTQEHSLLGFFLPVAFFPTPGEASAHSGITPPCVVRSFLLSFSPESSCTSWSSERFTFQPLPIPPHNTSTSSSSFGRFHCPFSPRSSWSCTSSAHSLPTSSLAWPISLSSQSSSHSSVLNDTSFSKWLRGWGG